MNDLYEKIEEKIKDSNLFKKVRPYKSQDKNEGKEHPLNPPYCLIQLVNVLAKKDEPIHCYDVKITLHITQKNIKETNLNNLDLVQNVEKKIDGFSAKTHAPIEVDAIEIDKKNNLLSTHKLHISTIYYPT